MAAGRPPHTPARQASVKAFNEILDKLQSETPPSYRDEVMLALCKKVWSDEHGRLRLVRALLHSLLCEANPYGLTASEMVQLLECSGWPGGLRNITDDTINNFVFKESRPRHALTVGTYLSILSVLFRNRHPAFRQTIPAVLVRYCSPLQAFHRIIGAAERAENLRPIEVIRRGLMFYQLLSSEKSEVGAARFDMARRWPLFSDAAPVTEGADLRTDAEAVVATAIRLGPTGTSYVTSKVAFHLLEAEVDAERRETVMYVRTTMHPETGQAGVMSEGFVVPQLSDVYLAQFHLDGGGLNIAAFPNSELGNHSRPFYRGVILAVDRDNNRGALSSRIVLLPNAPPHPIGTFSRSKLLAQLKGRDPAMLQDLLNYLHPRQEGSIQPIDDSLTERNGDLQTWGDLKAYLEREEVAEFLRQPSNAAVKISTYVTKPLLVD